MLEHPLYTQFKDHPLFDYFKRRLGIPEPIFDERDVAEIRKQGISVALALEYQQLALAHHSSFNIGEIKKLIDAGILPKDLPPYMSKAQYTKSVPKDFEEKPFAVDDIIEFKAENVPLDVIAEFVDYSARVIGNTYMTYANRIVTLWKAGISPSFLEKKQKEAPVFFDPLLTAISHIQALPGKYTLLATGTSGTILMNHQSKLVRKFANLDDMINEYKLLDKIYLHHKDHTPNIIVHHINTQLAVPKRETCESLCKLYPAQVFIDFDYINGQTVYQAMRQNVIGDADACAYGKDILNGLSAMKAAGIPYHNDLGPHNVMLDYDKHRAIIIDLGVAGKKKDPTRIYNVRFGGDNDLVSLGQMMYYMATGKHIFLNSPVKNIDLSDVVKEIGANRDAAYSDATGKVLEDYFTRVDSDIKDSSLSGIIKACLKAGPDDHDKIMKMFEDYKK